MKISNTIILGISFCLMACSTAFALGLYQLDSISYFQAFDSISYMDAKSMLLEQGRFHHARCIAYPLLLALSESVFAEGKFFFYFIYSIQLSMLFVVFRLHYQWLSRVLAPRWSLLLTLLLMMNASYMVYSFFLLTEIACLFFLALSFESYRRYKLEYHSGWLFAHVLAMGISVLLKPGLLLFMVLLFVFHLVSALKSGRFWRSCSIMLLAIMSSVGIQFMGMYKQYGQIKLSYIGDITMYRYMHTSVIALANKADILPLMIQRDTLLTRLDQGIEQEKRYKQFSELVSQERKSLMATSASRYIKAFGLNLFSNFHSGNSIILDLPDSIVLHKWTQRKCFDWTRICNMIFIVLLIVFSLGILFTIRPSTFGLHHLASIDSMGLIMLGFIWFSFSISGVSFYQGDRFNIIWMPFLFPAIALLAGRYIRKGS